MELIKWTDSYSVQIEEIDNQHKSLIKILNNLYDAFMNKEHASVTGKIIDDMISYTEYHFRTEEKYFAVHRYPEAAAHVIEHNEFKKKAVDFKERYSKDASTLTFELMNFLQKWLNDHIKGEDQKYVPFLKSKGLK